MPARFYLAHIYLDLGRNGRARRLGRADDRREMPSS
jgi:hypothetical protein